MSRREDARVGDPVPCILDTGRSSREQRKNWARLAQKIHEMDPLTGPKRKGPMRVIAVIHDREVIRKILD